MEKDLIQCGNIESAFEHCRRIEWTFSIESKDAWLSIPVYSDFEVSS